MPSRPETPNVILESTRGRIPPSFFSATPRGEVTDELGHRDGVSQVNVLGQCQLDLGFVRYNRPVFATPPRRRDAWGVVVRFPGRLEGPVHHEASVGRGAIHYHSRERRAKGSVVVRHQSLSGPRRFKVEGVDNVEPTEEYEKIAEELNKHSRDDGAAFRVLRKGPWVGIDLEVDGLTKPLGRSAGG